MRNPSDKLNDRLKGLKLNAGAPDVTVRTSRQTRNGVRRNCYKIAIVVGGRSFEHSCVVKDLSPHGARIAVDGEMALPRRLTLKIHGMGTNERCRVCWQMGREAGLAF